MLGKPVVVNDNRTAWTISSGVAPDVKAFLTEDMTEPLELTPIAIPSLISA